MTEQHPKKLLDQVRDAIRLKHCSIRTEEAYVNWVKRYIFFHGVRHPAEMGAAEVEAFLTHLAVKENVAGSTQNQALSALLFLYREVLHKDLGPVDALRARRPKRLPTALSRSVRRFRTVASAPPGRSVGTPRRGHPPGGSPGGRCHSRRPR